MSHAAEPEIAIASALARDVSTATAIKKAADEAMSRLPRQADLAMLFCSGEHGRNLQGHLGELCDQIGTRCLLGCTGESLVATGTEVEMEPAISLWLACFPGTAALPMHLEYQRALEGGTIQGWDDGLPSTWPESATLLVLGDPFSFPVDLLLDLVNGEHAKVPVVGGMASSGQEPGENRLFLGTDVHDSGAVAVWLQGGVQVRTLVSQGCRPIGKPWVITKSERNVIYELGGLPAYRRLEETIQVLSTSDQRRLQRGLHVGRVVSEYQDHFEQGDFLIRNVVGADQESGSLAITDYVRPGQTVQFHLRDAETASAELTSLLATAQQTKPAPAGALLFTCNGRGSRLFPEPGHDAGAIQRAFGSISTAGFFAAGELGPIGGQNFIHGFTASVALFSERTK